MKTAFTCIALAAGLVLNSTAIAQSNDTITLTTYNIHSAIPKGHNGGNYWPGISDLKNVADVLTTAGADIVALNEVRNLWSNPKADQPNQYPLDMPLYLSGLLDMDYAFGSGLDFVPRFRENREYLEWGNWARWTNNGARHGEYGNAILSKFPLAAPPELIKLPRGTDARAQEMGDEPRVALRAELKDPLPGLGRVVIYSTHFQHNNANTRLAQMRYLVERAKQDVNSISPIGSKQKYVTPNGATTSTVFLMGDFNHDPKPENDEFLAIPAEAGFHDLAAVYAENTGTKPHHTADFRGGNIRIDYIFCSRAVDIEDVVVLDTDVSDHLPLSVTIKTVE